MNRKLLGLLALLAVAAPAGQARADGYLDSWHPHTSFWSLGWEIGIPVNSFRTNWVDRVSPAGGQLSVEVGLVPHLSVGVAATYNWFDQTRTESNLALPDVTLYRRLGVFGLRGIAHYYLTSTRLQPFVGVGVGAVWIATKQQVNGAEQKAYSSYLAVDPEVGLLLNTSDTFALYALGRYQWTAANFGEVHQAQWVGVQVGMGWFF